MIWGEGRPCPGMNCLWRSKCWSSLDTGAMVRGGRRGGGEEVGGEEARLYCAFVAPSINSHSLSFSFPHTHIHTLTRAHTHAHTYMHVYTCMHTRTHIRTHARAHTHTPSRAAADKGGVSAAVWQSGSQHDRGAVYPAPYQAGLPCREVSPLFQVVYILIWYSVLDLFSIFSLSLYSLLFSL